MQPYFFPYLGYFDLINRTDRWVVFDVVKYVPKSWMNRNRILNASDGWQYVTVPVDKRTEGRLIKDVVIIDKEVAHRRILGQIEHYRKGRAPFFAAVRGIIDGAFNASSTKLADLNLQSLALSCVYLGIPFDATVLSQSDIVLPPIDDPGDWALEISAAFGADAYVNPPNGRHLFDPEAFAARGIHLGFTDVIEYRYSCKSYEFVDLLSIIDVMMWNPPDAIKAYLDEIAGPTPAPPLPLTGN
jgi:hypothetical protein